MDGQLRFAVVCLCAFACAARPQTGPSAERPAHPPLGELGALGFPKLDQPVEQRETGSGLRIVQQRAPGTGLVAVAMTIGAGSARDPVGQEGMAHLLEHVSFRARDGQGRTIDDRLRALGATAENALTGHDSTVYFALVPREALASLLLLEAGRLVDPLAGVTQVDLDVEREVVRNEQRERDSSGNSALARQALLEAVFPGDHPYARPTGGTEQTLARITLAGLRDFAARNYRPARTSLVIIGDFSPPQLALALASLPRALRGGSGAAAAAEGPTATLAPMEPPDPPAARPLVARPAPVATAELLIGWTMPSSYGPYAGLGEVLAGVLSQTEAELEEKDSDVVAVEFSLRADAAADTLLARVQLLAGAHPAQSAALVTDAVQALWSQRLADEESLAGDVLRTVLGSQSGTWLESESLLSRTVAVANHVQMTGDGPSYFSLLERLGELNPRQVAYFARAYLRPERARMVLFTPVTAGVPAVPAAASAHPHPTGGAPGSADDPGALARAVTRPGASGARRLRLGNGLEVVLLRRPGFPSVAAALGFHGGRAQAEPPGVELFLSDPLALSVTRFCGGAPGWRGLKVETSTREDASWDVIVGGRDHLSAVLASLAERAAFGRYDLWPPVRALADGNRGCAGDRDARQRYPSWVELHRRVGSVALRRSLAAAADPSALAGRAFVRKLTEGTGYYRAIDEAAFRAVAPADLERWIERTRQPANAFLILAGDFALAEAERLVHGWFEPWRPAPGATPPPPPRSATRPPGAATRAYSLARAGAGQVQTLFGCQLPAGDERQSVAGVVLAGYLERALQRRLRDSSGVTYGVHGATDELRAKMGLLWLGTSIQNERFDEALAAWRAEWRELEARGFDARRLAEVRWDLARTFNGSLTNEWVVNRLAELQVLGRASGELDQYGEHLAAITPAGLAEAFRACRASDLFVFVGDDRVLGKSRSTTAAVPLRGPTEKRP
jgi:zinc protease